MSVTPAQTFGEYDTQLFGHRNRIRRVLRDTTVCTLSIFRSIPRSSWLRAPFYHHVFDDQRKAFAAQLRFMKNLGDFVSLDEAVGLLEGERPLRGRYFCLSFDDAFRNTVTNALPILLDHGATAVLFIPTGFIADGAENPVRADFYPHVRVPIAFMSWEECRAWAAAGMEIGSHTVTHVPPMRLTDAQFREELRTSKEVLEQRLGRPCAHFACPYGRPGIDFDAGRHPGLASAAGYATFLTTRRGSVHRRSTPYAFDRDHTIASWSTSQLRYFFAA